MTRHPTLLLAAALGLAACDSPTETPPGAPPPTEARTIHGPNVLDRMNRVLEARAAPVRAAVAEYVTDAASGRAGALVFARDVGPRWLGAHFVPGDPRRGGRFDITHVTDATEGEATGGLTAAQTSAGIEEAMAIWASPTCTTLQLASLGPVPVDLGVVQNLLGFGGVAGWAADVTHAGWLPKDFFDLLAPDGGDFILGITFTLLWVDADGNFTDIDRNGFLDVAFREIYYNNGLPWRVAGPPPGHQVRAVATHEAGHGLGLAHFGRIFVTEPNLQLHFAPHAVMNAGILESQDWDDLTGSDVGGFCTMWGSWP